MNPDAVVARAPVLQRRTLHGFVVRPAAPDGEVASLGGTAAALWAALVQPRPVDALAADLARDHDADLEIVRADVVAALDDWAARGLVVVDG